MEINTNDGPYLYVLLQTFSLNSVLDPENNFPFLQIGLFKIKVSILI